MNVCALLCHGHYAVMDINAVSWTFIPAPFHVPSSVTHEQCFGRWKDCLFQTKVGQYVNHGLSGIMSLMSVNS